MLVKGDKIKLVKPMGVFNNIGEICEVIDVTDSGVISFMFGNGLHMGCMSSDEFEKYFEKYIEPKSDTITMTIEDEYIKEVMDNSKLIIKTVFNKCTIVACKLPNQFVIVESSACVDPDDYDEDLGVQICLRKIVDRIKEMEAYVYSNDLNHCMSSCNGCCDECNCPNRDEDCPVEEDDDC